jgi:thioredoxin 1
MQHATDETFEAVVTSSLTAKRPVIVDFWAGWCNPCKLVAPELEKLASKYEGQVDIVKVDTDANPKLVRHFNVMSIPTIAIFRPDGAPQAPIYGYRPAEAIERQFGLPELAAAATAHDAAPAAMAAETGSPEA